MKVIIGLSLIIFGFSGAAFAQTKIDCSSNSSWIRLDELEPGFLAGQMIHAYNGARLACPRNAGDRLLEEKGAVTCAGIWETAFARNGELVDRVARVRFMNESGKIRAYFRVDWDSREKNPGADERVTLDCVVHTTRAH